jgi:hypothetical protein
MKLERCFSVPDIVEAGLKALYLNRLNHFYDEK